MKRCLFFTCLAITLTVFTDSFANEKMYVNSKNVIVADNGIVVDFDGYAGLIETLKHDQDGIYVYSDDVITWIDKEGHYNRPDQPECPHCGDRSKSYDERERERNRENSED